MIGTLIGAAIVTLLFGITVYDSKKRKKLLASKQTISPIVQQVILLLEIAPEHWTYTHQKELKKGKIQYAFWKYSSSDEDAINVQISMGFDGRGIKGLWQPSELNVTTYEAELIMKAINQMIANKISGTSSKLLLGDGSE